MTLSIVILSYNTPDLIKQCVASIQEEYENELSKNKFEIIVVDNASEKENVEKVESYLAGLKNVSFVKNKNNLGFGRGCNEGARRAKGKYVLFLNSDTKILDRGLVRMLEFLHSNPHIGVLGGRLLNPDNSVQKSAGKFYNLWNLLLMLLFGERTTRLSPKRIKKVDWVSGAAMMVNKELFRGLGGFDKNIFMYMEDMEICFRAKKEGIETYYYPEVAIKHESHGSSNRGFAIYNIYKGILYFYKKHKMGVEYALARFLLKAKALAVYFLGKITHNSYYVQTYSKALELF